MLTFSRLTIQLHNEKTKVPDAVILSVAVDA